MIIKNLDIVRRFLSYASKLGVWVEENGAAGDEITVQEIVTQDERYQADLAAGKVEVVSYDNSDTSLVIQEEMKDAITGGIALDAANVSYSADPAYANVSEALVGLSYVAPSCAIIGGSTQEYGSVVADPSVAWTCNKDMTSRVISGAGTHDAGAGKDGSHIFSGANITTESTYTLTVNDGVGPDVSATIFHFHFPILYGMNVSALLTGVTLYSAMSKVIEAASGEKTVQYNGTSKYIYFCIKGDVTLSSIKDENGFNVTDSFNRLQPISVSSTGLASDWTENYTVYVSKLPTTITTSSLIFAF